MTSVAGAARGGGAGFATSTTGGGLTSVAGGAPCGACAIATMDSAASTATTRILTSNHRCFKLVLCKSLDFPVVVDARPGALRPAVDRRRPELACSQRGPCRLIQAAIAGGALDLALQAPAVHIDEKAQPHDAPSVRAQRGRRIRRLLASRGVDDRPGALDRRRRRRNRHRRRRLHHGGDGRRWLHRNLYLHLGRRNERRGRRGELGRRRGRRLLLRGRPLDLLDDLGLKRRAHHLDDLARQAMDQRVDQHDVKDAHGDQRNDGSGRGLRMRVAHGPRRRSLAELPQEIIGYNVFRPSARGSVPASKKRRRAEARRPWMPSAALDQNFITRFMKISRPSASYVPGKVFPFPKMLGSAVPVPTSGGSLSKMLLIPARSEKVLLMVHTAPMSK